MIVTASSNYIGLRTGNWNLFGGGGEVGVGWGLIIINLIVINQRLLKKCHKVSKSGPGNGFPTPPPSFFSLEWETRFSFFVCVGGGGHFSVVKDNKLRARPEKQQF